ncbi:Uncharacterised protein [Legionella wadsworthii]|uniref:Uncharacterized protein n=1 Tax=Legionella wadsworthii TaxID=28088 RepID=A0A378LSD7_9GAMM|nr:hypothetical protein [Legionella wadsworthii]STY29654.1 Uncharacterised protein [Legionella wadsworthii]
MKRKHESVKLEQHYYKEVGKKVLPVKNKREQRKIDAFMKRHDNPPSRTTRESGYSSYLFKAKQVEINSSMVKKQKVNNSHFLISRAPQAPALPISCLASTEHVIAMQDKVTPFESESMPETKKDVRYLISLVCNSKKYSIRSERNAILKLIHHYDDTLNKKNIHITHNKDKKTFEISASTQIADIKLLIRALSSKEKYQILSCNFEEIELNQGVCLVKKDASDPIHAMVNVVNSNLEKGFIGRDAGTTSGLYTSSYQDGNWTFNFFSSLDDMRKKNDYPESTLAIKIYKSP